MKKRQKTVQPEYQDMMFRGPEDTDLNDLKKKLFDQLKGEDESDDLLLKNPRDWTEEELRDVMKRRERLKNPVEKDEMFAREREWFDANYGTQPVKYDETGKMIQPGFLGNIFKDIKPVRTIDGQDLDDALGDVVVKLPYGVGDGTVGFNNPFYDEKTGGYRMWDEGESKYVDIPAGDGQPDNELPDDATDEEKYEDAKRKQFIEDMPPEENEPAYTGGSPNFDEMIGEMRPAVPNAPILDQPSEGEVVKGIQSGINILSNKTNRSPLPNAPKIIKLKEDGFVGPKTSLGLKKALVNHGSGKVSEAIAIGQFKGSVKKAKKSGPQNLAKDLSATFAPLLGTKKTPKNGFQPEGLALQDTLNDLGASKKGFEPLKDDGIVGPKTEAALGLVAKSTDEDELANQLGYNLGFDF